MNLEDLIHPFDREVFLAEVWETKPLIVRRDEPAYYRPLFSLEAADTVLTSTSLTSSQVRVVRDGVEIPIAGTLNANQSASGLEALYQEYRQGSTIVLSLLEERWPPLRRLSQALALDLSAGVHVNVYLTPRSARGFRTHYDTHDVFVLQVSGAKRWRVFNSPTRLPGAHQPYTESNGVGEWTSPQHEVDLNAGDCMYIPRGYVHDARALDKASIHLTVGVQPVTWGTVLLSAVHALVDRDAGLRESLPPGFAANRTQTSACRLQLAELFDKVGSLLDVAAALDDAQKMADFRRQPCLERHLLDLTLADTLNGQTLVRVRPGLQWRIGNDGAVIVLEFHGKRVRMPMRVQDELQFMASGSPFTMEELPGELDTESRGVLVRRLLHEGFLTVVAS